MPVWISYFVAALIAIVLVGLNIWLVRANNATPVPEGCENLTPDCDACGLLDCSIRNVYQSRKVEEKK